MPELPAIRQLVFLAADLESTLAAARAELGLGAGVKDAEGMAALGFIHEVLTIDQTFLEFSAPLGPDTLPGRLVAKRGDLGYMVVVQVADIEATKAKAAELGLKPVFETPYEEHTITQWHPRDLGTLAELDQIRPAETWHMAPQIFANGSTDVVGDFVAIEVAVPDPAAMAARWAEVLSIPVGDDGTHVELAGRRLRFVPLVGDSGAGLVAVELPATDRSQAGRVARISGVDFRLV
ncbi:Glyoxalase-like domain-containing protein [Frankineae bacterium MT45]|nr:Glyoxalase-like domain-containing protein [Frankineae bacterium MT45]